MYYRGVSESVVTLRSSVIEKSEQPVDLVRGQGLFAPGGLPEANGK
jgi:hypothetical protein